MNTQISLFKLPETMQDSSTLSGDNAMGAQPILNDYDIIAISTSGGKDSQAMMDLVCRMAKEQGFEGEIIAIHADLGRMEWKGTTDLVREQCEHYGLPLHIVKRPQGDLLEQIEQRGMWPSSSCRFCTSDHKRSQIRKVYTEASRTSKEGSNEYSKDRPLRILECVGLRGEESSSRAKKIPYENNKSASCGTRVVDTWLPIHDWTEEQVWECIFESGVRYHEAYEFGMPRLSCTFCIFAPKSALMLAGKHNPDLLDQYVQVEKKIGHTFGHPSKKQQKEYAENNTPLEERTCSLAYIQKLLTEKQGEEIKVENWVM